MTKVRRGRRRRRKRRIGEGLNEGGEGTRRRKTRIEGKIKEE